MVLRRSPDRFTLVGPLLTVVLLVGTACGSESDADSNPPTNSTMATADAPSETPAESPSPDAAEALRFRAPLVGGGEIDLSTLAGQPVVMWFWAPY